MKIKLNSTQVVVEVEVRVELGNLTPPPPPTPPTSYLDADHRFSP